MKLRGRLEFFLAKIAGRDIDVNTLIPAGASSMIEKLMLETSDRIDHIDIGFTSMEKVKDYLYEVYYDNLDYAVVTEMTEDADTTLAGKEYMTNFFLSDVVLNDDGTVFTPADDDGNAIEDNNITPHGAGLERYNYIVENIGSANTKAGMRTMMNGLLYSKAYITSESPASPVWCTEFVGIENLTAGSPAADFEHVLDVTGELYAKRTREKPIVWHTVHSAVYDINNMTMNIVVQEDGEELNFTIGDTIESLKQRIIALENNNN